MTLIMMEGKIQHLNTIFVMMMNDILIVATHIMIMARSSKNEEVSYKIKYEELQKGKSRIQSIIGVICS